MDSPNAINIILGSSPSINVNDSFILRPRNLQKSDCAYSYLTLPEVNATLIAAPGIPMASLIGPTSAVTLCIPVTITIASKINDGNRGFYNI